MDKKLEILQATLDDKIGLATIVEFGSVVELLAVGSQKRFIGDEYVTAFNDCIDMGLLEHKVGQNYIITLKGKEFLRKLTPNEID